MVELGNSTTTLKGKKIASLVHYPSTNNLNISSNITIFLVFCIQSPLELFSTRTLHQNLGCIKCNKDSGKRAGGCMTSISLFCTQILIKILFYLEHPIRIWVKENAPRTDGKAEEVAYSSPSISLSLSLCLFLSLFIYIYI